MEGRHDPGQRDDGGATPGGAAPLPPALEEPPAESGGGFLSDVTALLRNRVILSGLGILVVLLLLTIVLVAVGGGDGDDTPSVIQPTTPGADATAARPLVGLPGLLLATATMRNGPDATYAILGTIPEGARVPVVGRNEDATWLQVIYPPGRQLRGWVNATVLEVDGDVSTLVVAGPGTGPEVPIPTSFGFITPIVPLEPTATPLEGEATATRERPTRTPVASATRVIVATRTPAAPQPTPSE